MIYLGTSGWNYKQSRWLEFYAERFQTVELNNSFYRLPKPEQFASWRTRSPRDFVFTVKMSRFLTHIKRLQEPEEPVQRFLRRSYAFTRGWGDLILATDAAHCKAGSSGLRTTGEPTRRSGSISTTIHAPARYAMRARSVAWPWRQASK